MSAIYISYTGAPTLNDLRGNHKTKETKAINMIEVEEEEGIFSYELKSTKQGRF